MHSEDPEEKWGPNEFKIGTRGLKRKADDAVLKIVEKHEYEGLGLN